MESNSTDKKVVLNYKYLKVIYSPQYDALICEATSPYIPDTEFRLIFNEIEFFVSTLNIKKVIFDKRSLTVFNQESMTWYHVDWKERMLVYGLKTYRKLLPKDKLFKLSVEIGKEKILKDHPGFLFNKFDIQYCDTIEEALEN